MEKEMCRDLNASTMEACRICLATDIKLHSLGDTELGTCMESIAGLTDTCEGLPNYVCYQCAPILLKCGQLIAKIKTAQAALLDIFNKNGQVTKTHLKERNRSNLNLESSLSSYLLPNCDYNQYHSDDNAAEFIKTESVRDLKKETVKSEIKDEKAETDITELDSSVEEIKVETPLVELSDDENFISLVPHMVKGKLQKCTKGISSKFHRATSKRSKKKAKKRKLRENTESAPVGNNWSKKTDSAPIGNSCSKNTESAPVGNNRSKNTESAPVGNIWSKSTESAPVGNSWSKNTESASVGNIWLKNFELAPVSKDWSEFIEIQRDFTVSKIPFNEQITVWRHGMVLKCIQTGSELLCSVCQKPFSNADLLQAHSYFHNPSIHGNVKCGVCLICFASNAALDYHTETIHANRFNCKSCPMTFYNLEDAKNHKDLCMGPIAYGGRTRSIISARGPTPNLRPPNFDPRPQIGDQQNWNLRQGW